MAVYVIDANVWIRIWRNHPPDIWRAFWGQLDATIAGGTIRSPEEVREELAKGTDGLVETLRVRNGLFAPLDDQLMDSMAEVMARCPSLTDISGERNRADPFVIALARRDGGKVVSDERPKKPTETRLRIPDGCQEFGVPCLKWFDFLREIGWTL